MKEIDVKISQKLTCHTIPPSFHCIIDYGNVFMSSCTAGDLTNIQTLQNHALRCCHEMSIPRDEIIPQLHDISSITMVDTRRQRPILTCIWRNIKKV